ncbi:hypothetical protein M758_UG128600 [Ceratodon purpureus]|nr:hypothetical protein M758_UG128600 [Ceratodon purpureus]
MATISVGFGNVDSGCVKTFSPPQVRPSKLEVCNIEVSQNNKLALLKLRVSVEGRLLHRRQRPTSVILLRTTAQNPLVVRNYIPWILAL